MSTLKKRNRALVAGLCFFPLALAAKETHFGLFFVADSSIEIGAADFDDGQGIAVDAAVLTDSGVFLNADFSDTDQEFDVPDGVFASGGDLELNVQVIRPGLGYWMGDIPLYVYGEYIYVDYELSDGGNELESTDEEGFGVHAGVDFKLSEYFDLEGALGYIDVGRAGEGVEYTVALGFNLSEQFALRAEYSDAFLDQDDFEDTFSDLRVGIQLSF